MLFVDMILLALTTAVLSLTITRSSLTKPLRDRWLHAPLMIGDLINCPYCMAHWVALAATVLLWTAEHPLTWQGYIVGYGSILAVALLVIGVLQRLWLMQEGEIENLRGLVHEAHNAIVDLESKLEKGHD